MWLFIRPRHLEVKGRRRTTALLTASFIRLDPTCPKQALLPRWLNKPWAILRRCSKRWPAYKDGQRERERPLTEEAQKNWRHSSVDRCGCQLFISLHAAHNTCGPGFPVVTDDGGSETGPKRSNDFRRSLQSARISGVREKAH